MNVKKICILVGARPNFVKVAPLIRAIEQSEDASYSLVYAGPENDSTIEPSLFDDLQMPRPDVYLGVDSLDLNEITAHVMSRFDHYLDTFAADVVIVVDDLASTMAAAIVAKKRGLQLAHLVAGTRSFDIKMPKEINRLVIDALSDYLFTAGIKSNSVATREGGETAQTYMVGNILMDSLRACHSRLRRPAVFDDLGLENGHYLVLTMNRKALLAERATLKQLVDVLLSTGLPIVAPLRGLARKVMTELLGDAHTRLHLVDALPYLEFGWLSAHALGVVTDSGNVAEEATFNGVPCITLNSYTEHIETVNEGTNVLVDGDAEKLRASLDQLMRGEWKHGSLPERWDGRTAERIVRILVG